MIKPRLSARNLTVILFIILSLASTVFIFASTLNYIHFFPALDTINPTVSSVYYNPSSPIVRTNVTIANPSDYQGLTLTIASIRVEFTNGTLNLFHNLPLQGQETNTYPLGPHTSISETITIIINLSNATALNSLVHNSPGQVTAHVVLTVQIGTFLDPVTGNTQVSQPTDLPLTV
jgi:hypothetical protein